MNSVKLKLISIHYIILYSAGNSQSSRSCTSFFNILVYNICLHQITSGRHTAGHTPRFVFIHVDFWLKVKSKYFPFPRQHTCKSDQYKKPNHAKYLKSFFPKTIDIQG
jgi:hypothetical protein